MTTKSLYQAALQTELRTTSGINTFNKLFETVADAYAWLQAPHQDIEIIPILRKLGYKIPQKDTGNPTEKFRIF